MKAILEFSLPEERMEHLRAVHLDLLDFADALLEAHLLTKWPSQSRRLQSGS